MENVQYDPRFYRQHREIRRAVRTTRWNPHSGIARYRQIINDVGKVAPAVMSGVRYLYDRFTSSSSAKNNKMPPISTKAFYGKKRKPAYVGKAAGVKRQKVARKGPSKKFVKQMIKSLKPRKRVSYSSSEIGGRISKPRYNNSRDEFEMKCLRDGYIFTQETCGKEEADHCAYVGHGTDASVTILGTIAFGVVRRLFKKADNFTNFDGNVAAALATSTVIIGLETKSTGVRGTYSSFLMTQGGVIQTYRQVAVWLYGQINSFVSSTTSQAYFLDDLTILDDTKGTVHRINLKSLIINYRCESTLKLQNISYTADALGDDDNAMNVDRIPLIGKGYSTKGPYFTTSAALGINRTRPFAIDRSGGVLLNDGGEGYTNVSMKPFQEPPSHKSFVGAYPMKGVSLPPGVVKTDKIVTDISVNFNKFIWLVGHDGSPYAFRPIFGRTHMFALEKLIHLTTDKIRVGYEVNQKHFVLATGGFSGSQTMSEVGITLNAAT